MFDEIFITLKEDILPVCGQMAVLAKSIAMIGLLIYTSAITLKSLAIVEPINFMAYLKPLFAVFCIMLYEPVVMPVIDGFMTPIARATNEVGKAQAKEVNEISLQLMSAKQKELPKMSEVAYLLKDKGIENNTDLTEREQRESARKELFSIKKIGQGVFMYVLEKLLWVIHFAASMIISVVSSLYLIILAILGPLAFAFSCFPIFDSSVANWLTRYITISLWVPIANILSAILSRVQLLLCHEQLGRAAEGKDINNMLVLAVMIVGIFGYLSVPSVADWIIQSGGTGSFTQNLTRAGSQTSKYAGNKISSGISKLPSIKSQILSSLKK